MIVVVFGLPGTGKSYFAGRLAEIIKAEYISSDRVRFKMIKDRAYTEEEKMKVYDQMLVLTRQLIRQQKRVVLDATFYRKEIRQMFVALAASLNVKIYFIEVTARELLVKKRVSKKRKESEADYEVYRKVKALFQPMVEQHLTLESQENNIREMLEKAAKYLG
ncbi:MAG: AAA family ATPase [Cytophagales bacterium]|nr:AAA family ATPase [Cytophagales bacterium]